MGKIFLKKKMDEGIIVLFFFSFKLNIIMMLVYIYVFIIYMFWLCFGVYMILCNILILIYKSICKVC